MYLKRRGLPQGMLVAGVVAMCDAIRQRSDWIDPALVALSDDLDALARAALMARDRRVVRAFCTLAGPAVAQAEQALAVALVDHVAGTEGGQMVLANALLELGWTPEDLNALAQPTRAALPAVAEGPDGRQLACADEAEFLARRGVLEGSALPGAA